MACSFCDYKGYITSTFFANNASNITTRVCPQCNDLKAYSDYVMSKYKKEEKRPMLKTVEFIDGEPLAIITKDGCVVYNFLAWRKKLRGV